MCRRIGSREEQTLNIWLPCIHTNDAFVTWLPIQTLRRRVGRNCSDEGVAQADPPRSVPLYADPMCCSNTHIGKVSVLHVRPSKARAGQHRVFEDRALIKPPSHRRAEAREGRGNQKTWLGTIKDAMVWTKKRMQSEGIKRRGFASNLLTSCSSWPGSKKGKIRNTCRSRDGLSLVLVDTHEHYARASSVPQS